MYPEDGGGYDWILALAIGLLIIAIMFGKYL